jgi:hypothetical protein
VVLDDGWQRLDAYAYRTTGLLGSQTQVIGGAK